MGAVHDLDAGRREAADEPIAVVLNRREWVLPPQLPASVLDPLIDGELDDLLALFIEVYGDGKPETDLDVNKVLAVIGRNPRLLSATLRALRRAFEQLLGEEQWQQWLAMRPSLPDYFRLGRAAFAEYGVGLGEALGLSSSSETDGRTSKQTSQATPRASTRGGSGSRRGTRS